MTDKFGKPLCKLCEKGVYPSDVISIDGEVFHKHCFRCYTCGTGLTMRSYVKAHGRFYCRAHYDQAVLLQGNLYGGFGVEKPKPPPPSSEVGANVADGDDPRNGPGGVFLVDWDPVLRDRLVLQLHRRLALTYRWDEYTTQLCYEGCDEELKAELVRRGRFSKSCAALWIECTTQSSLCGMAWGVGRDNLDQVKVAYQSPLMVILDMVDLNTFVGETSRALSTMDIFFVTTHEVLVHFFAGLDHGKPYVPLCERPNYSYDSDETLKTMNAYRMAMALPIRLSHPPNARCANEYSYYMADPFPDLHDDDVCDMSPTERKAAYEALRCRVPWRDGNIAMMEARDVRFYPAVSFVNNDECKDGTPAPGRRPNAGAGAIKVKLRKLRKRIRSINEEQLRVTGRPSVPDISLSDSDAEEEEEGTSAAPGAPEGSTDDGGGVWRRVRPHMSCSHSQIHLVGLADSASSLGTYSES